MHVSYDDDDDDVGSITRAQYLAGEALLPDLRVSGGRGAQQLPDAALDGESIPGHRARIPADPQLIHREERRSG